MRTAIFIAVAALAVPAAAAAQDSRPADGGSPAQLCRAERAQLGAQTFKTLYGTNATKSNAFGKCVAKKAKAQDANEETAAAACREERNDPGFSASHGGKTFEQFYGTGKKGKNAFGKCVSAKAKAVAKAKSAATVNAAQECKRERAADPSSFREKYGTNKRKSNAFGKCVSRRTKETSAQP